MANQRKVLVLDPGHGGLDGGMHLLAAMPEPFTPSAPMERRKLLYDEKDVTILAAKDLRWRLHKKGHEETKLTREGDVTLSLRFRCDFANGLDAAAFVSLHVNDEPTGKAHGFQVFHHTPPGSEAHKLAEHIAGGLAYYGRLSWWGARTLLDFWHLRKNLYVLKHTVMPAVLVELFFGRNTQDFVLFSNPATVDATMDGLANGIMNWLYPNGWPRQIGNH